MQMKKVLFTQKIHVNRKILRAQSFRSFLQSLHRPEATMTSPMNTIKYTLKHCRQNMFGCSWSGKFDDSQKPTGPGQITALKANKTVTYTCVLKNGAIDGYYLEDLQGAYTTLACCNEQHQVGYGITYVNDSGSSRKLRLEHYNAEGVQDKLHGMSLATINRLSQIMISLQYTCSINVNSICHVCLYCEFGWYWVYTALTSALAETPAAMEYVQEFQTALLEWKGLLIVQKLFDYYCDSHCCDAAGMAKQELAYVSGKTLPWNHDPKGETRTRYLILLLFTDKFIAQTNEKRHRATLIFTFARIWKKMTFVQQINLKKIDDAIFLHCYISTLF